MQVKELKMSSKEPWLLPDRVADGEYLFDINSYEMETSKAGGEFPVLSVCGSDGEWIGDFKISAWERDVADLVSAFGSDSAAWKGKRCYLVKSKGKFMFKPFIPKE